MMAFFVFPLSLFFFSSCSKESEDTDSKSNLPPIQLSHLESTPLHKERAIRRISITLLGRSPYPSEMDRWKEQELEDVIDDMFEQPELFDQLTFFFTQWLLTRVEDFNLTYHDYHLDSSLEYEFLRSIGEEAPRLMSYVATQNTPWTDIVTANYTLSNDILLEIWPLELVDSINSNEEWFLTKYTDGRPSGGVLMSNGLWWRYYTTPNNNNRARAAALMNLFLCENLLLRPILFQATALLEADEINNVIQTDPACIGCHNALDPLASAFFGFWWFDIYDRGELSRYHPEREFLGEESDYLNTSMAYFGQPMYTPAELGIFVSQDPRFLTCTVEKTAQLLWQRNIQQEDHTRLAYYRNQFVASSLSYQSLLKMILLDDEFQSSHIIQQDTSEENRYLLQPHQLESTIFALTGFLWETDGTSKLQSDNHGYRQLLGGVDGREITKSVNNPTLSRQLVIKRLAQNSAEYWVQSNWEDIDERGYAFIDTPLSALNASQRKDLFGSWLYHTTSIEATEEDIEKFEAIYENIVETYDPKTAYTIVISIMLRSIDFWSY